ncbi:MAG: response regulator [Gammaproteobacteria bacterium]|nr:response regulator [Gammaproteobacteria bacterium]MDH5731854.1 response regulator [Gammaproteobacteria bacterium]
MSTKFHILLVEDDEVDAMNVKRAFKKLKVNNPLHHASNGIEALNMLRGGAGHEKLVPTPRIILLDLNMPQMNGIEFLTELRKDKSLKSISVIVLTTSNEEQDKVAAYDLNVAGYVLKPVETEQFFKTICALNVYWEINEMP